MKKIICTYCRHVIDNMDNHKCPIPQKRMTRLKYILYIFGFKNDIRK